MANNNKAWMGLKEIADELNVSIDTLYKWRAKRDFPVATRLPNGSVRVRRSDLDAWLLDSRRVA